MEEVGISNLEMKSFEELGLSDGNWDVMAGEWRKFLAGLLMGI